MQNIMLDFIRPFQFIFETQSYWDYLVNSKKEYEGDAPRPERARHSERDLDTEQGPSTTVDNSIFCREVTSRILFEKKCDCYEAPYPGEKMNGNATDWIVDAKVF